MTLPMDQELLYEFHVKLFFPILENPGWFTRDRVGRRQAKTRFKIIDVDNRVKFLQDTVAMMVGLPNDSQIFRGTQEKYEDPNNPRVEVTLRIVPWERFFGGTRRD